MKTIQKFACLIAVLFMSQHIFAQSKAKITTADDAPAKVKILKADDLPRRSVTIVGKAVDVVKDEVQLNKLNDEFIKNLEADLVKYDIQDKATLKSYYQTLLACYFFKNDYEKVLSFIPQIEVLEDKMGEKLTTAAFARTYVAAARKIKDIKSEAFREAFVKEYATFWNNLPYKEVKEVVESIRGSLSIFNPTLITSDLESLLQPYLDNNKGVVPEAITMNFVSIRVTLDKRADLIPDMLKVINELYEKNKETVVKQNIWAERDVVLAQTEKGLPVVIGIWDSGTDTNVFPASLLHKDKDGKSGIGYSLIDFKNDGLLLENPEGKIKTDVKRLQLLTKGFMDLQAAIQSPEVDEVRKVMAGLKSEQVKDFQEELGFYGNYSHGTHVAGIAVKDNPFAKLLVARMGFDYRTLPPAHTLENAKFQAKMYADAVKYFKENKVRVVNMSWRYNASAYESMLSLNGIGKNDEERKKMAREMFDIEKKALYNAFKSAPEILFICGSGNENNDAGFEEYIPASFQDLPNLITIGAVDGEGKKTSFTTEGKSVRFYANGFEVESFVPGGDRIKFSGTSMASPNVANLAGKILALKPTLSPKEVIELIEKGSDNLPENPKLKLINPKKTIELLTGKKIENSVPQLLTRKWKPDANTATVMVEAYIEEIKKQNAEQAKAMEAQKEALVQMFAQVTVEYKTDGTVEITVPQSPTQKGTWEIATEEGKAKLTSNIAGQKDFEIIDNITDKQLNTTSSKGKKYVYLAL